MFRNINAHVLVVPGLADLEKQRAFRSSPDGLGKRIGYLVRAQLPVCVSVYIFLQFVQRYDRRLAASRFRIRAHSVWRRMAISSFPEQAGQLIPAKVRFSVI